MANEGTRTRRRHQSHNEGVHSRVFTSADGGVRPNVIQEGDGAESRRNDVNLVEVEVMDDVHARNMAFESQATLTSSKSRSRRTKDGRRGSKDKKHRSRRPSSAIKEDGPEYVPEQPRKRTSSKPERRSGSDADDSEEEVGRVRVSRSKPRRVRYVYVTEVDESPRKQSQKKERYDSAEVLPREKDETVRRSRSHQSRRKSVVADAAPLGRSASTKEVPSTSRASIKRSKTTTSHVPSSTATNSTSARRSSFIGGLFSGAPKPVVPEKLVECLTCMDEVPKSKAAKLKCGHRMCNSCLKRIFRMSVTDPQHMPPKCCTPDHIALEHVDKLFDSKFKRLWNKKFAEFSTKNRIYCPAKKCGEWIKPSQIHRKDGRKYGECGRCKTKVCCSCNCKWHGSRDCPNDEETNKLLDAAKEAGWQRCYSCRTMVELKEGCNHMTCHCTAQFCMICGLKWKTCECPWFNYDAVEADRLEHMQMPEVEVVWDRNRPNRLRRPQRPAPPNNYRAELEARRRQEREDEDLARRLERAAFDDDDYQGGIGDINGVGNGAGHFMNENFVRAANILTGNVNQAAAAANYVMGVRQARGAGPVPLPPRMAGRFPVPAPPPFDPPPVVRTQSARDASRRDPERPRQARRSTDREAERRSEHQAVRPAVLAGLSGRGGNRVNAWRNHVSDGPPDEGVLSV